MDPGPADERLTRQQKRVLKNIFKSAATRAITPPKKGPLYLRYEKMSRGATKPSLAKLTCAHIIGNNSMRMWKD